MLRFGTSGIPRSTARPGTVHGIRRARELGLDHLEMAWVNGVRMSDESADAIAAAAREHDLSLTAHAPYFVNLCGAEDVVERSRGRLEEAARLGTRCGAQSFCFHAGFYGTLGAAEANCRVRTELRRVATAVRRRKAIHRHPCRTHGQGLAGGLARRGAGVERDRGGGATLRGTSAPLCAGTSARTTAMRTSRRR
jgi:endonuclease IV